MKKYKFKKIIKWISLSGTYISAILIFFLLSTYQKEYQNFFLILFFGITLPSYLISIISD
jgi:hypothetical protein